MNLSKTHLSGEDRIPDYDTNSQGSIRAIVDENGNLMASYTYDAWGSLISYNGTLAEKNDYLYTGREYDWDSGIYYYRARYYNPEIGRFLSQDPDGMVDGPNMYVYACGISPTPTLT